MIEGKGLISIWFFIGVLLLAYGIVILAAGIYNVYVPPEHTVVLQNLHAAVWWGVFLTLIGAFYTYRFFPKGNSNGKQ
jgi:low temperature requirement protein LtrA